MSLACNATDSFGDLQERLDAHGQDRVLRFWSTLDAAGRRSLTEQLLGLDLEALAQAWRRGSPVPGDLEPPLVERLPSHGGDEALLRRARECGEARLAAGRVAALVVAGGQGTRLGHGGPKGTLPLGPVSQRSLLGLQAQKLRGLQRRYGRPVPWLVMTSSATDLATRAFFSRQDHFGLDSSNVFFVVQRDAPCLDFEGHLMLAAPHCLAWNPDGHGGVVAALAESGVLEDLGGRGIETLFYYQVDNPLVRIGDPALVGLHSLRGAEVTSKVVAKQRPDERVGTLGQRDGRLVVVEYTELTEPARSRRGADGELAFWAGAIGIHALEVKFLARVAERGDVALPYHLSAKRIPSVDAAGRPLAPAEPNGYKLERFVFDALPLARGAAAVEVKREEEYSPIKNTRGAESPDTARRALSSCVRGWFAEAGVEASGSAAIEVDHSRIDDAEDVRALGIRQLAEAGDAVLIGPGDNV